MYALQASQCLRTPARPGLAAPMLPRRVAGVRMRPARLVMTEAKKKKKKKAASVDVADEPPSEAPQANGAAESNGNGANGANGTNGANGAAAGEIGDNDDSMRMADGLVGSTSGIRLANISKTFKNTQVLKDVSWEVKKGERVGLVGYNGAGKTTQLQIIMGNIEPDGGEIMRAKKNMKVAYLKQEFDVDGSRTVREELASVFGASVSVLKRIDEITSELENIGDDMEKMGDLLDEMEKLNRKATDLDTDTMDAKIDKVMAQLGFAADDNERLVAAFSGGWQMRMMLGKLLLQDPDILLLDEPTNHIDLETIEWLENYLKEQDIPMVIVSHDREFLDQLCTKIVETERGYAKTYDGNYTAYLAKKSEDYAQQMVAYEKEQKEIKKLREMIQKLSAGAQSGRAEQAKKQLERMKKDGLVEKPWEEKRRRFEFPVTEERCGQVVVECLELTKKYDSKQLFENVDLVLQRGERVAILGPNGAGKSTFLKLIRGLEKPNNGIARLGPHNIVPNYFEQNQAEALELDLTVLKTLQLAAPDADLDAIKALLGQMMFSGKAMEKKVSVLSGGEKARLALAKFMLTPATLLILDEPTNHLDIPSKEMLEHALKSFDGAVLAVSHDRYFLRQISTRVIEIKDGDFKDYEADYSEYLEMNEEAAAKEEERAAARLAVERSNIKAKSKMSKAQKKLAAKKK